MGDGEGDDGGGCEGGGGGGGGGDGCGGDGGGGGEGFGGGGEGGTRRATERSRHGAFAAQVGDGTAVDIPMLREVRPANVEGRYTEPRSSSLR